jgi:hypothetical protein
MRPPGPTASSRSSPVPPWRRNEGMSAHPNRDAPLSSAEHWCGPLCPTTNVATKSPLAGLHPHGGWRQLNHRGRQGFPSGRPDGPALTAPSPPPGQAGAQHARARTQDLTSPPRKAAFDFVEHCLTSSASSGMPFCAGWRRLDRRRSVVAFCADRRGAERCSCVLSRGSGGAGRPVMGHSVRAGSYQAMRVPVTVLEWRAGRSFEGQPVASGSYRARPATPMLARRAGGGGRPRGRRSA